LANDRCIRPPFTGREKEMEQLMSILSEVMFQQGNLVLLAGEAGVGKTRIAEEFEEKAVGADCISIVGRCMPGLPTPLLPFIEAFESYYHSPSIKSKSGIETSLFGRIGETSSTSWSMDRILFSTLDFIRRKSAIRPMIIRIEDLHWVDSASVQLIHFLARNAIGLKIMILGTYRPEDLLPDSSGNPHPFVDALRIMRREGVCQEIEVGNLEPTEVRTLVNGVLGGSLEAPVMDKVIEESEGNPLYAIETTKLLALSESIRYIDGLWRASESIEIKIPPTAKEVVLRRLDRLEKGQRKLLDFASVIGREFSVEVMEEASGSERLALLENLENIQDQGRLICQKGSNFQFSHETIRQVAYESISEPRRREIHRIIGEVLERRGGETSPATLAMHFHASGDRRRCVKYSLAAAEACLSKGAAYEAVRLLGQVVKCAGTAPEYQKNLIQAYDSLGLAYLLLGRDETADEMLQRVITIVGIENASSRTLYNLAEIWAGTSLGKGSQTRSMEYLDMAEKAAGDDQYELAKIAGFRATSSLWRGEHSASERNFKTAIEFMMRVEDTERAVMYKSYLADVLMSQGKVEEALEEIQEALFMIKGAPGFYGELEATFYAGTIYLHIGNVQEAIEHLNRSVNIATQIGEFSAICHGYSYLSLAHEMLSQIDEASAMARLSYENALRTESQFIMLMGMGIMLHNLVRTGKWDIAEQICNDAASTEQGFKWSMHSTTRCLLTAALAEHYATKKDWEMSDRLFEQSFDLMIGTPSGLLLEILARSWYAESLSYRGLSSEAREQLRLSKSVCSRLHNACLADLIRRTFASL
jgi:tetratricopeptide (TPR) repeat protein